MLINSELFDRLRRFPDVEAPNLLAVDAADRLILDEADAALVAAPDGSVVVIDDHFGALTLGAAVRHDASGLRVHQDSIVAERALAANAEREDLADRFTSTVSTRSFSPGLRWCSCSCRAH